MTQIQRPRTWSRCGKEVIVLARIEEASGGEEEAQEGKGQANQHAALIWMSALNIGQS